jgi:hypothetical protein
MIQTALSRNRRNYYSQNGEDGVIEEILNRLQISHGFCVEFGAWDGQYLSNTYHLIHSGGWRGLYIEGDPDRFGDLIKNEMVVAERIVPVQRFVAASGENTLDEILTEYKVPKQFELLSIDIDGNDLDVWASLRSFQPQIVIVEVDSSIEPKVSMAPTNGHLEPSFANGLRLGQEKGYVLVCHTGNMIFVHQELAGKLHLGEDVVEPEMLFDDRWVREKNSRLVRAKNHARAFVRKVFHANR